jgi:DNA-binding NarL/FixJ family response regulator
MSANNGVRVMLVDDHPLMRRGLREVLEDSGGFEVVGEAADGVEAVGAAQESRPDVIVMDVMMPKKDGVEACRDILDLLPDTKVVMLTASTEEDAVIEAIAAGATGFVQKYSGSEDLVDALRKVAEGRLMIPEGAVMLAFKLIRGGAHRMPGPKVLSAREREVLTHFGSGKPYARIAEDLGVSTVTVRNAIYRIQDKLGVASKQEIVVWAVRNGLLDDGEEGG